MTTILIILGVLFLVSILGGSRWGYYPPISLGGLLLLLLFLWLIGVIH